MASSDHKQVPWKHTSWPANGQSGHDTATNLNVGAKRAAPTISSSTASSSQITQQTSNTGKSNTQHSSKRRRSRARPSPPVTHISAQDKAHFKALAHHFTGIGAPSKHSLLPPLSGLTHNSHFPPAAAPAPGSQLAIAQSLKSTLRILFACLQLLHGSPSSSQPAFTIPHAELDTCKTKALALLQALDHSQLNVSVLSGSQSLLGKECSLNEAVALATESQVNGVVMPTFASPPCDDACLNSSSHNDDHPNFMEPHKNIMRAGMETTYEDAYEDGQDAQLQHDLLTTHEYGVQHTQLHLDYTNTHEDVQHPWLQNQAKELEMLLLEGNNKDVDDFFSRDSLLFQQIASGCCLLASN